jgi:hypothetical protein
MSFEDSFIAKNCSAAVKTSNALKVSHAVKASNLVRCCLKVLNSFESFDTKSESFTNLPNPTQSHKIKTFLLLKLYKSSFQA